MLYLLHFLLHEAKVLSSEEQKNLQMASLGDAMHLPSGAGIGAGQLAKRRKAVRAKRRTTTKRVEKQKGNCNCTGKERTASLPKRQQKGLHCTETEALRVG